MQKNSRFENADQLIHFFIHEIRDQK